MTRRLVVVGGDAGGMSAASVARRRVGPDELEIVAFERGPHTSYSACGLPYFVGGLVSDVDELVARTPEEHRRRGIDVQLRHEVLAVDPFEHAVVVRDLDVGAERRVGYDGLVLAVGASPSRPPIPGIDAEGVLGVQTLADGVALHDAVTRRAPRDAVVVGGGYVGLEMAEALVRRGLAVTVVDQNAYPLGSTLDADAGGRVADALRGLGIEVRLEQAVDEIEVRDGAVRGVVTGGERLPADLVVLGLGVEPNVALARDAGIELGPTGAIATDSRMRSSVEEIWAAGDCVEVYDRVAREPAYVALGTHANKQGRVVGTVATGGDAEFPGVLGTAVTRICDYEVGRTGLTEQRARELGYDVASLDIDSTSRASYLPDAEPIWVKVVVDRPSGRLLGAQVFGREGAAKRVDVLAVCLWNEMTVDEIPMVDLGYAPSVAPLWDPVLVATLRASSNE